MERFLMQIMRMFLSKGMNAGIKHVASKGKSPQDMTPEERTQAKNAQSMAKRAQQLARISRRIGR